MSRIPVQLCTNLAANIVYRLNMHPLTLVALSAVDNTGNRSFCSAIKRCDWHWGQCTQHYANHGTITQMLVTAQAHGDSPEDMVIEDEIGQNQSGHNIRDVTVDDIVFTKCSNSSVTIPIYRKWSLWEQDNY